MYNFRMKTVTLNWEIALRASQFDENESFLASSGGIYLWLMGKNPPRVYYVGETANYKSRHTHKGPE